MKLRKLFRLAVEAFRDDRETARYELAERLCRRIYPKYKFSEFGRLYLEDKAFIAMYERLQDPDNYHSMDRAYSTWQLLKLVLHLPGDTAECGVYRGGTSDLICRRIAGTGKRHLAFDSYEGLSEPGAADGVYWRKGDMCVGEAEVRRNLAAYDFVEYHKGWIPDCFAGAGEGAYCFAHVDVDLYEPTLASIVYFYERLVPGGILLCDDYGFTTCLGARKAMEEFFEDRPEPIVELPTGQGFVIRR